MAVTRAQKQEDASQQQPEENADGQERAQVQVRQEEEPPECHFFKIPGELRNRIYREVLVIPSDEHIFFATSGYHRPGLLNVSKQIRAESATIYYTENKFRTHVHAFDSEALFRMSTFFNNFEFKKVVIRLTTTTHFDQPSWKNLLVWLRRLHAQEIDGSVATPEQMAAVPQIALNQYVVGSIFLMVRSLGDLPWAKVEDILKGMRPTLIKADWRWGED